MKLYPIFLTRKRGNSQTVDEKNISDVVRPRRSLRNLGCPPPVKQTPPKVRPKRNRRLNSKFIDAGTHCQVPTLTLTACNTTSATQRKHRAPKVTMKRKRNTAITASQPQTLDSQNFLLHVLSNNLGEMQNPKKLQMLMDFRNLVVRMLPCMPINYVTRTIFDRSHISITLSSTQDGLIGGVCFREFAENGFIELVFLAISDVVQVKGYGTYLLNNLKEYARRKRLYSILTYADKNAFGFFEKQAFRTRIITKREKYVGVIKDYREATLVECRLLWNRSYSAAQIETTEELPGLMWMHMQSAQYVFGHDDS